MTNVSDGPRDTALLDAQEGGQPGAKAPPVEKNDDIIVEIIAMGSEGQGIGRYEGFTVMVPFALPGEQVHVHIIKVTKHYAVGKLMSTIVASPNHVQARCSAFGKCGGCAMQHIQYDVQLMQKQRQVSDALTRIGGFRDVTVEPVLGMENPWYYRNKAAFPVGEVWGKTHMGMYASNSHRLIPIDDCPIQFAADAYLIALINRWVAESGVLPYLEDSDEGTLRHVVFRKTTLGEVMVVIVTKGALFGQDMLVQMLRSEVEGLKSIVHNRNDKKTNVIMGEKNRLLYGNERIAEMVGGLQFDISATSFLQVNPAQNEKIIEMMLEDADLQGHEKVLDAYCGVGTLTLALAKKAYRVTGMEVVRDAVNDAQHNALINGITNAAFMQGAAEELLDGWKAQHMNFDVVVLDPPRKGCEAKLLKHISDIGPARIVYISCNPATLARDARILADSGYTIARVRPVDMFPQTAHVETVMLMTRTEMDGAL